MDLGLQYEELKYYSCVLDTVTRREETQETIVSDSMPDIGTVVTATATPLLRSCRAADGSVSCEGEVAASVIYESEEGGAVYSIPVRVPFHCSVESGEVAGDCRMNVLPQLLGVEVKVMNPRKVLVQTELSIHFFAFAEKSMQYSVGVESGDHQIQTRMESVSFQYVSQVTEKTFPFEESISLSGGHRGMQQLLSCDATPYCSETKIVGSKVVFKGGVKAKLRFLNGEGKLASEEYDLPVSQVLDAGDSGENAVAMVSLSAAALQADVLDQDDIAFGMELYACAALLDRRESSVLSDAYSTLYPCQCAARSEEGMHLADHNTTNHPFRQAMDLELPSAEVLDQSVTLSDVSVDRSGVEGARCRLKVCACLRERDGHLTRVDQNCYVDVPLPSVQADRIMVEIKLLEATCISAAGGMEVRGNLLVHYAMLQMTAFHYLSGIELDDTGSGAAQNQPSAVLRMLREGESLWDLGKEYFATVEDILAVNQISDETAAGGRFLLIPRNR